MKYYVKNLGQDPEDARAFIPKRGLGVGPATARDAEDAAEHAWYHHDGADWLQYGETLTLVDGKGVESDWDVNVYASPVFVASAPRASASRASVPRKGVPA